MERGEIAPEEQFLLSSTMFCYLMLDFYVKTRIRFSLRDKRLFEITEVEITRVDCTLETEILQQVWEQANSFKVTGYTSKGSNSVIFIFACFLNGGQL